MPTEKKTKRVTPEVKVKVNGIKYKDLNDGDCFIMNGAVWMKSDIGDQEAVRLEDGQYNCDLCDEVVIPVDIKVTWKEKT